MAKDVDKNERQREIPSRRKQQERPVTRKWKRNGKRKRKVSDWTWNATGGDSDVYWHNQSAARCSSSN